MDEQVERYNQPEFITADPISIPKQFEHKEDIEIAGFLTALISWGNRKAILNSADLLMHLMDHKPYEFVTTASDTALKKLDTFIYRTFNASDLLFLLEALKNIYLYHGGLEGVFTEQFEKNGNIKGTISGFRNQLLKTTHLQRSEKHLANPEKGSAAKRINMFLRWMVRYDNKGIDFGLWKNIPTQTLMIPLDLHSGATARKLGLLKRKQNDWKAVEELTMALRKLDPDDPVKYDFALFGMGINNHIPPEQLIH